MKNLFPMSVAGAMALGAVGAHASIAAPLSGSSDVVLFAEVTNAAGTSVVASFAGDTNISINTFLTQPGKLTALAGDSNLGKLFAADTGTDQIVWGIMGGEWASNPPTVAAGNTKLITTIANNAAIPTITDSKLAGFANAYSAGITALNSNLGTASSIEGATAAGAGIWDVNTTSGLAFWGGSLGNSVTLGTTANLYYLTGGGSALKNMTSMAEGTAVLSASGLTIQNGTSPPPVPLPPAVWLFGSGLLGLAGVARRKAKA